MEKSNEPGYVLDQIAECVSDGFYDQLAYKYNPQVEIDGEIMISEEQTENENERSILVGCPDGEFEITIKRIH